MSTNFTVIHGNMIKSLPQRKKKIRYQISY